MNTKKINHIIMSGLASFFYFLILLSILKLAMGKDLFDTPFMVSLYLVPCTMLIYGLLYDKINPIIKNKYFIITLVVFPIILFTYSLFVNIDNNSDKGNKKPDDSILEDGKNIFDNATDIIGKDDFDIKEDDKDVIYRQENDLILKEDEDGNIRQFKPLDKSSLNNCEYKVYEIKNGYLLACTYNENINFYSKDAKEDSIYYKLNVPKRYLDNIKGYGVTKLNIMDESTYKKYIFDEELYYTETLYSKLNVYKQFNDDLYLYINSYDLKEETSKYYEIRSWYDQRFKIVFIAKDYTKYQVTYELNKDLSIKPNFTKELD